MKALKFILVFTFTFAHFIESKAQQRAPENLEMTDYIQDIQMWQRRDNKMALTFWIPNSYWRVALKNSEDVTPETLDLIEDLFKDMVIICALEMETKSGAQFEFAEEADLRKTIYIEDGAGVKYQPMKEKELSTEAAYFAAILKPMFIQMLGQMGNGLHLYFFTVKDNNGFNVINEFEEGNFTVHHSNCAFKFYLPLVSLLPKKTCPTDGREMDGNWKFCPFHGIELKD